MSIENSRYSLSKNGDILILTDKKTLKSRNLDIDDIDYVIDDNQKFRDTNISNMEDPDTKVAKLKTGTHEEQREYKYGGYKLFVQEYEAAKVSGFILYMEGFDLRLFDNDGSRKSKTARAAKRQSQSKTGKESRRIGMLKSIIVMSLDQIQEKF